MAREVSTNGRKKVYTLMKEFNANFPYLRLSIHSSEMAEKARKGETIYHLDVNKTLSEVREKKGSGEISFTGSKNVRTIEREFDSIFGLYVQICFTTKEGKRHYTTSEDDSQSLTELNREKETMGCQKDIWE